MTYVRQIRQPQTIDELSRASEREFQELERVLPNPVIQTQTMAKLGVEPDYPVDGLMVYADGTNWNPDTVNGQGIYQYRAYTITNITATNPATITATDISTVNGQEVVITGAGGIDGAYTVSGSSGATFQVSADGTGSSGGSASIWVFIN